MASKSAVKLTAMRLPAGQAEVLDPLMAGGVALGHGFQAGNFLAEAVGHGAPVSLERNFP